MTDQATTTATDRRKYHREYYMKHKADRAAYQREYRRKRKAPGDRMTREELRMLKCKRTVPLRDIMEAKVKPEGVSDVRWRIELSRRRLAAKERSGGGKGDLASLPDPDIMW